MANSHRLTKTSLGAFFPRGEGRKFVPRGQRERDEQYNQPKQFCPADADSS